MSETTVSALIVLGALAFAAFYARQSTERSRVRYMGRAMADLLAKEAEMHTRRVIARAVSVLVIAITGAIVAPHGARLVQSFRYDMVANQGPGTVIRRSGDVSTGIQVQTSEQGGLQLSDNPVYVDASALYPNKPAALDSIFTMDGSNGSASAMSAAGWSVSEKTTANCSGGSTGDFATVHTDSVPAPNPLGRTQVMRARHCAADDFPPSNATIGAGHWVVGGSSTFDWGNLNSAIESHQCQLYISVRLYEPGGEANHGGKFFYLATDARTNATWVGGRWNTGYTLDLQGSVSDSFHSTGIDSPAAVWRHEERLFEFETVKGNNTGRYRLWVDGVLRQDVQNLSFEFTQTTWMGWTGTEWYDKGTLRTFQTGEAEHNSYMADYSIWGQPCSDSPWNQTEP